MSKYFNLKSQKIQGSIITILVIIEILIVCKIFFLNYSDLFTRNGIFLSDTEEIKNPEKFFTGSWQKIKLVR